MNGEDTPPSPKRVVVVVLCLLLGTTAAGWGIIGAVKETSARQQKNTEQLVQVQSAASLALQQATHDHAFIFAVCKRFNRDETLAAQSTKRLSAIESKFPEPNPGNKRDVAYHEARIKALKESEEAHENVVLLNCPKAMQRAYASAPTDAPSPAPSPVETAIPEQSIAP